ncbi:hypothetical protein SAMN05216551_106101 [Chitinasiproducens palmae]|uniref:Uncharacterized protein n=1 Tax=Chitinasiproducens palmae TaxID=1770053 RepID=A0A1H2PQW3_9BURK|nr:hypothetical protein SAMN05216551_106101 [Chitinasiproducens palmae]
MQRSVVECARTPGRTPPGAGNTLRCCSIKPCICTAVALSSDPACSRAHDGLAAQSETRHSSRHGFIAALSTSQLPAPSRRRPRSMPTALAAMRPDEIDGPIRQLRTHERTVPGCRSPRFGSLQAACRGRAAASHAGHRRSGRFRGGHEIGATDALRRTFCGARQHYDLYAPAVRGRQREPIQSRITGAAARGMPSCGERSRPCSTATAAVACAGPP